MPGGLASWQALELVRGLAGLNLVGMDLVEVSPPFDHAEITALAAAHLAHDWLCVLAGGGGDDAAPGRASLSVTRRAVRARISTMNEHRTTRAGRATYQDVVDAPEHNGGRADPRRAAPAAPSHFAARADASMLVIEIGGPFDRGRGGPGGWWIIDKPELHFGEDVLVPELLAGGASRCRCSHRASGSIWRPTRSARC